MTGRRMPQNIDVLDSITPYIEQDGNTTVFGGNIEVDGTVKANRYNLYRHVVKATSITTDPHFFFLTVITSSSTVIDSLTDLKNVLGNTFEYPVSGRDAGNDMSFIYMNQAYVYNQEDTRFSLADYAFTDTVTPL